MSRDVDNNLHLLEEADDYRHVKAVCKSKGFEILESEFQKERKVILDRLMHPNTPASETYMLKKCLNLVDKMTPTVLGETFLKRVEAKVSRRKQKDRDE
jgi:hypothetical protein